MKCQATTKTGKLCGGFAISGSKYCFTHDPAKAAERLIAHRKGGFNHPHQHDAPMPECDLRTTSGLSLLMDNAIRETWKLQNSLTRERTLAYLVQVQRSVLEVSDIEARIKRLEDIVAAERHLAP